MLSLRWLSKMIACKTPEVTKSDLVLMMVLLLSRGRRSSKNDSVSKQKVWSLRGSGRLEGFKARSITSVQSRCAMIGFLQKAASKQFHKPQIRSLWGHKGQRVGEADHPGPEEDSAPRRRLLLVSGQATPVAESDADTEVQPVLATPVSLKLCPACSNNLITLRPGRATRCCSCEGVWGRGGWAFPCHPCGITYCRNCVEDVEAEDVADVADTLEDVVNIEENMPEQTQDAETRDCPANPQALFAYDSFSCLSCQGFLKG